MSISATEHHGDDPHTNHYNELQHFSDEFNDYMKPLMMQHQSMNINQIIMTV